MTLPQGTSLGLLAKLRAMKRCEICKVAIGDGTGAHALGLIAGVLAEVVRLRRNPLADHLHAFGSGGIDDLGAQRLQFIKRVAEDGHDHMVFAETLAFGFEIIGGDIQRFHQ